MGVAWERRERDGLVVVEGLAPCDQGETGEGLGLEFECEVEVLFRWLANSAGSVGEIVCTWTMA